MNKALFLDRDGVINVDVRYPYLPEHIRFCDGIFDVCTIAQQRGYMLIVVTNQAGVAKGYYTENDVNKLHEWMWEKFSEKSITITAFYYCPYHEKGTVNPYNVSSECRKPNPGMILQAVREHNIDLSKSIIVGDKQSDRINLPGLRSIIIKSQYATDNYNVKTLYEVITLL